MRVRNLTGRAFGLDLRSLALARAGLALVLLVEMLRVPLPDGNEALQVHLAARVAGAAGGLALLAGFQTRWVSLGLWLLLQIPTFPEPYHWLHTPAGSALFFLGYFLPWNAVAAVDRALTTFPLQPSDPEPLPVKLSSAATWAFQVLAVLNGVLAGLGYTSALAWIPLLAILPTLFWKLTARRSKNTDFVARQSRLSGYYDNDCGFCRRMISIIRHFTALPGHLFGSAQGDARINRLMEEHNSWVLYDGQRTYFAFEGFVRLLSGSPLRQYLPRFAQRVLKAVLLHPLVLKPGNRVYKWIAEHRMVLGPPLAQLQPGAIPIRLSPLEAVLVLVALFFVCGQVLLMPVGS